MLPRQAVRSRRELRNWPRYRVQRNAGLIARIAGDAVPCEICDISLGGAKLRFAAALPPTKVLTLAHPELSPLRADRLWEKSNLVGIQFDFSEQALTFISHCLRTMRAAAGSQEDPSP